jgi:hypothetical protein
MLYEPIPGRDALSIMAFVGTTDPSPPFAAVKFSFR